MKKRKQKHRIAALYVEKNGPYFGLANIDAWGEERDARKYAGPWPVVAHPPCERWGRYWSGGPSAKVKRTKGDDKGCFKAALSAVLNFGGVVEHPEGSHAWAAFGLLRPNPNGGWTWDEKNQGWVCQVEQGNYGHPARKKTWLFVRSRQKPIELNWRQSRGIRLDEGFHSKEERRRARANGQKPIKKSSPKQNKLTPEPFRDLLILLAKMTGRSQLHS